MSLVRDDRGRAGAEHAVDVPVSVLSGTGGPVAVRRAGLAALPGSDRFTAGEHQITRLLAHDLVGEAGGPRAARSGPIAHALRRAAVASAHADRASPKADLLYRALWEGLVDGRWSRVDDFVEEGRRFLLAIENEPDVAKSLRLSPRERTVVERVLQGASNKLIAYELSLSVNTVATHLAQSMRKLGTSTRTELIGLLALRRMLHR